MPVKMPMIVCALLDRWRSPICRATRLRKFRKQKKATNPRMALAKLTSPAMISISAGGFSDTKAMIVRVIVKLKTFSITFVVASPLAPDSRGTVVQKHSPTKIVIAAITIPAASNTEATIEIVGSSPRPAGPPFINTIPM